MGRLSAVVFVLVGCGHTSPGSAVRVAEKAFGPVRASFVLEAEAYAANVDARIAWCSAQGHKPRTDGARECMDAWVLDATDAELERAFGAAAEAYDGVAEALEVLRREADTIERILKAAGPPVPEAK